jgi:hypothetical protein
VTEPVNPVDVHWDAERMRPVVDGAATAATKQAVADHLGRCAGCLALFADLIETRLGHALDPKSRASHPEWVEIGLQMLEPSARRDASPYRRSRSRWVPISVAALLALGIVSALLVAVGRRSASDVDATMRAALEPRLRADSPRGLLYAPGLLPKPTGERGSTTPAPTSVLKELARQHAIEPRADPDYWLIAGYLATGQERNVQAFLDDALKRYPDDTRFSNLAAIDAVKRDQLVSAEEHLRAALDRDASGLSAFNLAAVLRADGRLAEARSLLERVATSSPHAELRTHAAAILAAIGTD